MFAAKEHLGHWAERNRAQGAEIAAECDRARFVDATGSGREETVLKSAEGKELTLWSSDGKYLLFSQAISGGGPKNWCCRSTAADRNRTWPIPMTNV